MFVCCVHVLGVITAVDIAAAVVFVAVAVVAVFLYFCCEPIIRNTIEYLVPQPLAQRQSSTACTYYACMTWRQ